MKRLWAVDLFRLRRDGALRIGLPLLLGLTALWAAILVLVFATTRNALGNGFFYGNSLFAMAFSVGTPVAIITGVAVNAVVHRQFATGFVKEKLASGYTRLQVFAVSYLVVLMSVVVAYLLYGFLFFGLTSLTLLGWGRNQAFATGAVVATFFMQLVNVIVLASFAYAVAIVMPTHAAFPILLPVIVTMVGSFMVSILPGLFSLMGEVAGTYTWVGHLLGALFVGGRASELYQCLLSGAYGATAAALPTHFWLYQTVLTGAFGPVTAAGALALAARRFGRADIK